VPGQEWEPAGAQALERAPVLAEAPEVEPEARETLPGGSPQPAKLSAGTELLSQKEIVSPVHHPKNN
jgi:hypothetical protein